MSQYIKEDDPTIYAFRWGAEEERDKIVAWLKINSHHAGSRENDLAEAIEAGEHVK